MQVCDFNLSEILRRGEDQAGMETTNPRWLAPEVLGGQRATAASDAYSFGLVLWELLSWQIPWGGANPFQIRRWVLDGLRPELPALHALPGPDPAPLPGHDEYCQLLRSDTRAPNAPGNLPTCAHVCVCHRVSRIAAEACRRLPAGVCRECWAQAPSERPTFSQIVPRLSALLDVASA